MSIISLRSQIWNLRVENADGRRFVPHGRLRGIFTTENIREALREAGVEFYDLQIITDLILAKSTIIFSILLHIREVKAILIFITNDQLQQYGLDSCLPFRKSALDFLPLEMAERFWESQWEFTAPIFSKTFYHRELDSSTIMPFLKLEKHELIGEGGFGSVYLLELHPQHHELNHLCRDGKVKIVRKEINREPTASRSISTELRVLSVLNSLKHPNILELLGSYTLLGKHNLLFPLASQSLGSFFSAKCQDLSFPSQMSVILALPGLTSALKALHSYASNGITFIGCHHDIKPDNILIADGKFILADFGLSTLKASSGCSDTYFRYGQGFYFAPECEDFEDNFERGVIGRPSDIWSLGCVLLELLVFMELGASGVKEFQKDRRVTFSSGYSTSTFHFGKTPNLGVERYIEKLRETAPDECRKDLVILVSDLLRIAPNQRPKAHQLSQSLHSIVLKHVGASTESKLDNLDIGRVPFELSMEMDRFRSWNKHLKAISKLTETSISHITSNEATYHSTVHQCLKIKNILETVQSTRCSIRTVVDTLRRANDDLTILLGGTMYGKISKEVELHIPGILDAKSSQTSTNMYEEVSNFSRAGILASSRKMLEVAGIDSNDSGAANERMIGQKNIYDYHQNSSQAFDVARFARKDSEPQDVLIQWLVYDSKRVSEIGDVMFSRVEGIVECLHRASQSSTFHAMDCYGYYHEPQKHAFGLVFGFPRLHTEIGSQPIDLHQLIQGTQDVRKRPALGHTINVASTLASSLLEYHNISWLHKSISPHNILFFEEGGSLNVQFPFIIGFDHGQFNEPTACSMKPGNEQKRIKYQHPLCRSGKYQFCVEFDYFSLGVVLLEIGFWKPIDDILCNSLVGEDYDSYTGFLREHIVPILGPRMGNLYKDAVLSCLSFETSHITTALDEGASISTLKAMSKFRETVVKVLEQCKV